MYKVINIGTQAEHTLTGTSKVQSQIFCKIKIEDGELSISGVIGPLRSGACRGCAYQIYDEIKPDVFADGWNQEKLGTFIDIWKEWHLNGMKAYTPEMKAAGWDKLASKAIYKYSFGITSENRKKRESLEKRLIEEGVEGKDISLSDEEKRLLKSRKYVDIHAYEHPETPEFMEISMDYVFDTKKPKIEKTTLGWTSVREHPDGLIGRELNGERYGCKRYRHELPQKVIDFLEGLPESKVKPAWV